MKINIYYGGRGLIEDSTIYTINKLMQVFEELNVKVTKYNLYEQKNSISMLPNTMKDVDGIVLAVNVEWLSIGGYMHQLLDAMWLYADKEKLKKIYMMPVVISNTIGEREAETMLAKAWEYLGGKLCPGICAYVANHTEFETNPIYAAAIENSAEELYRAISQKKTYMPSSSTAVTQGIPANKGIELTPAESEQLSVYVSDDSFVKKQKEDLGELTALYKEMLEVGSEDKKTEFFKNFREAFKPIDKEYQAKFAIQMTDVNRTLVLDISHGNLKLSYENLEQADVFAKTTHNVVNKLVSGVTSFQGAFMSGAITAKGDFKLIRSFDQLFSFK